MPGTTHSEGQTGHRYNGWANYETWAVALWLDNEQSSYERVREMAEDAWHNATETTYATRGEAAGWALAATLKAEHEEASLRDEPEEATSVFSDLLSAAL